jgi:hypothetical protein
LRRRRKIRIALVSPVEIFRQSYKKIFFAKRFFTEFPTPNSAEKICRKNRREILAKKIYEKKSPRKIQRKILRKKCRGNSAEKIA